MTTLYFDCYAGAAGDMIIGALLDAGLDFDALKAGLAGLDLPEVSLTAEHVTRNGLSGTKFDVHVAHHHHHHDGGHDHDHESHEEHDHEGTGDFGHEHGRHLADIQAMIDSAGLPAPVVKLAHAIFLRLGRAEAQAHSIALEKVHFHEVGAADSIIDIVGAALALHLMGIEKIICNIIPTGSGTVKCAHGILPVPAPATAELLKGTPTTAGPTSGELTTPTAAAILVETAESFGPIPTMTTQAIGYGAGTRESADVPNLLRVIIGEEDPLGQTDAAIELEANIDDCSGEVLGAAMDRLWEMGALDVWVTPIQMKKSRPAWTLHVLVSPTDAGEAKRLLFTETTTFGLRERPCRRTKLARRHDTVETAYGPIRVKVGSMAGRDVTAQPEFADADQAARAHGSTVRAVMAAAHRAWEESTS